MCIGIVNASESKWVRGYCYSNIITIGEHYLLLSCLIMLTAIVITVLCNTSILFLLLGVLSSIAIGLFIRLAVYGVDACLRYGRNRDNQLLLFICMSTQVGIEINRFLRGYHCRHSPWVLYPHRNQGCLNWNGANIQLTAMEDGSVEECCSICLEPFKSSSNLVVWMYNVLCIEIKCLQACISREMYRWVVAVVSSLFLFS